MPGRLTKMKAWLLSFGAAVVFFIMMEGFLAIAWWIVATAYWCLLVHPYIFILCTILMIYFLTKLIHHYGFGDEN